MKGFPADTGFGIKSSQTKVWLLFVWGLFFDKNKTILLKYEWRIEGKK